MSDDLDVEVPEIDQYMIRIGRANKFWALGRIIVNLTKEDQVIIFSNTKRMVDLLVQRLDVTDSLQQDSMETWRRTNESELSMISEKGNQDCHCNRCRCTD